MRKKLLALLLTVALLCSLCATPALAAGVTFPDAAQHWAASSISRWSAAGIAKGDLNGNIRPNDSITRAEFATVLVRLLGLRDNGVDYFTDVQTGDWYAPAVRACAAAGIMNGFEDGTARPNQPITREEAMVMFGRAVGVTPASRPNLSKFTDGDRVSSWAAPYMAPLTDMGILSGMGDGTVLPRENINRASTFALLDKAISSYITQPGSFNVSDPNGFVIINTPYEPQQTVTLSGHIAGVAVAPGDTSNLIFDGLTANTVKVDGPVAISLQARTDLGAVTLNVPATLDIARNTQVDSIAMNHDRSILNNKGEVGTVLANTAAVITNDGTVDSLEADAAVQLKNNGVLKSATVRANNVILDGRPPLAMTVAAAVTKPPATSAGKTVTAAGNTSTSSGGSSGGGGGSRPAASSVTFLPMDAGLYATIGWEGIPALADLQEDVTFTASGTSVRVGGTLKYVKGFTGFNPSDPAEQSGHYVALMFKVPSYAVGKGTVTMVKAEGSQTDKVFTLTEDVLDTAGSDKVFASIYHVTADSRVQYKVDWDGSGSGYSTTTYTLTFSSATLANEAVPADVIAANLGQINDDSDLPANGLATGYQVVGTTDPIDPARVNVTIKAATLKSHANALGTEGYWIGFGMPNPERKALTYLVAEGEGEASEVASIAGRFQEVDGKAYNTVYFTAGAVPTTYTVTVKDGGTTVMTYVVTVDVALREGAAVEKDALAAAITAAEAIDMAGVATSADGTDVPTDQTWVTSAVKTALTKALADAKTVNANDEATQADVNAAAKALRDATAAWDPKPGTKSDTPDPVEVDKTALTAAISAATAAKDGVATSADGTDVATDKKWVTEAQMGALNTAITAAEGVANNTSATQAQVDQAVTDLNAAVTTFNGQKQDGTKEEPPTPPTEYDITVTAGEHGTAVASVAKAVAGTEITLTITPEEGYVVDQITSDDVTVTEGKFTMPAKAVTVTVTFKVKGGEEPDPGPTKYAITVADAANGTVTTTPADEAEAGAEVTITATPAQGYEVGAITVTDADNGAVTVAGGKFTMPAKAVTVTVTFEQTGGEEPEDITITLVPMSGTLEGGNTLTLAADATTYVGLDAKVPTYTGYTFLGWYSAASDGELVTGETAFDKDTSPTTLYARWVENPTASNVRVSLQDNTTFSSQAEASVTLPFGADSALYEVSYQWTDRGVAIAGATGSTLTLKAGVYVLNCKATVTVKGHSETAVEVTATSDLNATVRFQNVQVDLAYEEETEGSFPGGKITATLNNGESGNADPNATYYYAWSYQVMPEEPSGGTSEDTWMTVGANSAELSADQLHADGLGPDQGAAYRIRCQVYLTDPNMTPGEGTEQTAPDLMAEANFIAFRLKLEQGTNAGDGVHDYEGKYVATGSPTSYATDFTWEYQAQEDDGSNWTALEASSSAIQPGGGMGVSVLDPAQLGLTAGASYRLRCTVSANAAGGTLARPASADTLITIPGEVTE